MRPRTTLLACLVPALSALSAAAPAREAARCLPRALFATSGAADPGKLVLGFSEGVPTLCAENGPERAGYRGCWTVDPATGALGASAATRLAGRSTRAVPDREGCIAGHCPAPKPEADALLLFAVSTDGAQRVILANRALHVFEAGSRAPKAVIPLDDATAPSDTNVSNAPVAILFLGDRLYVIGSDAGPYIGVWAYASDGRRLGLVKDPRKAGDAFAGYSVYNGAAGILDDRHVGFAEAALQSLQIVERAGGAPEMIVRPVRAAPCTAAHREDIAIGDLDRLPRGCRATVARQFRPYFDADLIRLPSGAFLAALSGRERGTLALLDGRTLVERRRLTLRRCAG